MMFDRFITVGDRHYRLTGFTATTATIAVYAELEGEPLETISLDLPPTITLTHPGTLETFEIEADDYSADLVFGYLRSDAGPYAGGTVVLPV